LPAKLSLSSSPFPLADRWCSHPGVQGWRLRSLPGSGIIAGRAERGNRGTQRQVSVPEITILGGITSNANTRPKTPANELGQKRIVSPHGAGAHLVHFTHSQTFVTGFHFCNSGWCCCLPWTHFPIFDSIQCGLIREETSFPDATLSSFKKLFLKMLTPLGIHKIIIKNQNISKKCTIF